jgi:hypothetical protein
MRAWCCGKDEAAGAASDSAFPDRPAAPPGTPLPAPLPDCPAALPDALPDRPAALPDRLPAPPGGRPSPRAKLIRFCNWLPSVRLMASWISVRERNTLIFCSQLITDLRNSALSIIKQDRSICEPVYRALHCTVPCHCYTVLCQRRARTGFWLPCGRTL